MPDYKDLGTAFRICYYISSLSLQYGILLVVFLLETFENDWDKNKWPTIWQLTSRHVSFIFIIIFFVISVGCLFFIRNSLNNLQNYDKSFHTTMALLCSRGNSGFNEFFLNIVVPIVLALPCSEFPLSTFAIIVIIQLMSYHFISISYDMFPNLSLSLVGYNIYKVQYSSNLSINYVWGRNHKNKFYYGQFTTVIPFNPREKNPKFGVIEEKNHHE